MTDILRTVVTNGLGSSAAISNQPVAGKTGTTTDSYDLWFCGFTPQYTAALWMGNDINIELSAGSSRVAGFWQNIMSRVCEDLPRGSFAEKAFGRYYCQWRILYRRNVLERIPVTIGRFRLRFGNLSSILRNRKHIESYDYTA